MQPDDWQHHVLSDWLGEDARGQWSAKRAGLAVPRQNGKNGLLEVRELFGMVALGEKFLHTAHEVKTARKAFTRLSSFFENRRQWPELHDLVESIRKTNGQEAILLRNGGSVEFVARSRGSGRGYTVDVLVADEAQELNDEQLEALLSTISSAPTGNPQLLMTGTPPVPGAPAEVWKRTREQGLERAAGLAWHEWSMEDDADLDDPDVWYATNPALGIRLGSDVIDLEREQLSDDGFARERLGSWASSTSVQVIDPQTWSLQADVTSMAIDRLTLAIDVPPNPEQRPSSVALAGQRADGIWHVELYEHRVGTDWIGPWVAQTAAGQQLHAVVVDEMSGLVERRGQRHYLSGTNVAVTPARSDGRDMAIACAKFYDAIMGGTVVHTDQPQVNVALSVARKRSVGAGWAWNRKTSESDITPLVAETLALWGAQSQQVNRPGRGHRTGDRRAVVI